MIKALRMCETHMETDEVLKGQMPVELVDIIVSYAIPPKAKLMEEVKKYTITPPKKPKRSMSQSYYVQFKSIINKLETLPMGKQRRNLVIKVFDLRINYGFLIDKTNYQMISLDNRIKEKLMHLFYFNMMMNCQHYYKQIFGSDIYEDHHDDEQKREMKEYIQHRMQSNKCRKKNRLCSICHQGGHNRKTCDRVNDMTQCRVYK
jgi:hypothetical protein